MALDKAIESGNEWRKPYRRSKKIDCSCRNHGSCFWCRDNRLKKFLVREIACEEQMKEYEDQENESEEM